VSKNVNPLALLATALVALPVVSGCGGGERAVKRPFSPSGSVEGGPSSGSWGDGSSGPSGMHTGCIPGRRFAVVITVHNRSKRTIMLLGAGGPQPFRGVIERVAAQVRLAPSPPKGDLMMVGLRSWSARDSSPVAIPPERDGWVQSNFLMRNCALLRRHRPVTVNPSTTLRYSSGGSSQTQFVSIPGARIILIRGPIHPRLPINHVG
jgi:hypothetical protein